MFERFTAEAREAVIRSQAACRDLGHPAIGTEHVLLALLTGENPAIRRLAEEGIEHAAARRVVETLPAGRAPDPEALRAIGVDLEAVPAAAEAAFGPGALDAHDPPGRRRGLLRRRSRARLPGHLPFTRPAKAALQASLREALQLHHRYIGAEHILLGVLTEPSGKARRVVEALGADPDAVAARTRAALGPDAAAG